MNIIGTETGALFRRSGVYQLRRTLADFRVRIYREAVRTGAPETDGHIIRSGDRDHRVESTLQGCRATQLYRTFPHEVGHWDDFLQKVDLPGMDASSDYATLLVTIWRSVIVFHVCGAQRNERTRANEWRGTCALPSMSLRILSAALVASASRAIPGVLERQSTCKAAHMSPRLPFTGLFICGVASAQTFSFGVVGGASVTSDFQNSYQAIPDTQGITLGSESEPERYIVGGMFEFRLPRNWSIEVDGLYHPLRYDSVTIYANGTSTSGSPSPVITFEFPVLAKYRFRWGSWSPFLEGGPSFRTTGNLNGTNPSHYGATVGVGAETRLGRFRISPEVHYIRWAGDPDFPNPLTSSNQVELLTSVSTAGLEGGHAFGQRVSLGVVLGATLTPDFRSLTVVAPAFTISFSSPPGDFLLGPMVEVAIARGFFFEGDAFHQALRSTSSIGGSSNTETWDTWTFPLLGKYKFPMRGVKPFIEAGPAFRDAREPQGLSSYGVTAGAGIETHLWRFAIAPSVRYTHWGPFLPNFPGAIMPLQNQVAALVGFSL
jgi:hypothetical protein